MRRVIGALAGVSLLFAAAAPAAAQPTCNGSAEDAFRAVSPAVVSVLAVSIDPFSLPERLHRAVGSGVVIDDAGHVLTNSHIVLGSSSVVVRTGRQQIVEAELVGADPVLDLAVLQLPPKHHGHPAAALGDSDALEIGNEVLAIGNAFGLGLAVSKGIISGTNRIVRRSTMSWLAPLLQTDAAMNAGNSGGPLVNLCGEVIGINSFRVEGGAGVGFSLPVNLAKQAVPELIADGRIKRPWHGINGKIVEEPLRILLRFPLVPGFLVETVEPGSAADQIGLRGGGFPIRIGAEEFLLGGDIITRVNGEPLTDWPTAIRMVRSLKVGDTVAIEYFRDGAIHTAEVVLPERPILPTDLAGARTRQAEDHRLSGEPQ